LGAGVSGKEASAGKIGYGTWDANALCIVGAGTTSTTRKVRIWEHLEVNTGIPTGDLRITSCTASNIYSVGVTAGTLRVTNSVTVPSIVAK
jgi:hypothetical protein